MIESFQIISKILNALYGNCLFLVSYEKVRTSYMNYCSKP